MPEDFSEENMRQNCPFCDQASSAYAYRFHETGNFSVQCDANVLREGHVTIIPKQHISCVGEYPPELFAEFSNLARQVTSFLEKHYGQAASFEHGIFGQSVYHSHTHYLPFAGSPEAIVPEGMNHCFEMKDRTELKERLKKDGGYLFFSIGQKKWFVDPAFQAPRFFRDRFANALGQPKRGNWKEMRLNPEIMKEVEKESLKTISLWKSQSK